MLIVEDDADIRLLLRVVLDRDGYDVVGEAEDGIVALELLAELVPDVLVVDMNMPRLGGLELIRRVRARSAPVIVGYSAAASEDEERELLTLGIPVVSKTAGTGALLRMLEVLSSERDS